MDEKITRAERSEVERQLAALYQRCLPVDVGRVASYYDAARGYYRPEDAGDESNRFGICVVAVDGETIGVGDDRQPFAMQSISKVFDERHRRPYNPMVNAGALVTTDLVRGADTSEKMARILEVLRRYSCNDSIDVDEPTLRHELANDDRNSGLRGDLESPRPARLCYRG